MSADMLTNPRGLPKRKSENDLFDNFHPKNKRLLTERMAADMGVLRLCDVPFSQQQDQQGIEFQRPPFQRTVSTPSNIYYSGPAFTPSRPDLVSSFELTCPQSQRMDEDLDMSCDPLPSPQATYNTTLIQPNTYMYNSQNIPPHLLNTSNQTLGGLGPLAISPDSKPDLLPAIVTSSIQDEESEECPEFPTYKLLIPKLKSPTELDFPFIQDLLEPQSRALILYTAPKDVIQESINRNRDKDKRKEQSEKEKEILDDDIDLLTDLEATSVPPSPPSLLDPLQCDSMILD